MRSSTLQSVGNRGVAQTERLSTLIPQDPGAIKKFNGFLAEVGSAKASYTWSSGRK